MAGIQMSGLASGLDTAALISQLMSIERIPRHRMERNQAAVQARQDALRDIQTKLKALRTAANDLKSGTLWAPSRAATSDDAARVSVRSTGGPVTAGVYDVEVQSIATTASQTWTTRLRPNASTLTITDTVSGVATNVSIAANSTVDQVVAAINAQSGSAATAVNDNGQLRLNSKTMGAAGNFTITGQALDVQQSSLSGTNAAYTVNGVAYSSTTNLTTTGIGGVELDLKGLTTAGTPVKVTVTETPADKTAVAAKFKAFVEAYNGVVDLIRSKTGEKGVANPQTITDAKKGVLFGDHGLTGILGSLRNGLMDPLSVGNGLNLDELHEIGLSTGGAQSSIVKDKVDGKLAFDETKFNAAWDNDRASVERLVRGDGTTGGFTQRLEGLLGPMTEVSGLLDGRITSAGSELKRISDGLARIDKRLERREEFFRRQFTSLETALMKAQAQQTEMAGQLAGLMSSGSDK